MSLVFSNGSLTYSGPVKVFWVNCFPGCPEAVVAERLVEEAAKSRGYNCVGIRCGMHSYSPVDKNSSSGVMIYDEKHITADFARVQLSSQDWHMFWEDNRVPGHIYTDGQRITRLELYGVRNRFA